MAWDLTNTTERSAEEKKRMIEERKRSLWGTPVTETEEESSSTKIEEEPTYPLNTVVDLPLDIIQENPDNEKIFNMNNLDGFAESIGENGFSGAIEVFSLGNGKYEISSGHRRFNAIKKLNKKTIPAIIYPEPSKIEKAKKLVLSNVNNRRLTPLDWALSINYWEENVLIPSGFKGDKVKELARVFQTSQTTIKRYIAIGKMVPELQVLLADETFPYTALDLCRTFTPEQQVQLSNDISSAIAYEKTINEDYVITSTKIKQLIANIDVKKKRDDFRNLSNTYLNAPKQSEATIVSPNKENVSIPPLNASEDNINFPTRIPSTLLPIEPILNSIKNEIKNINFENYEVSDKDIVLDYLNEIEQYISRLKESL